MLVSPHLLNQAKIDPEAKTKIDLKALLDSNGKTFYVGKWQSPLLLDLSCGVSFMAFVSESGLEQLHISIMDPKKRTKKIDRPVTIFPDGKMKVPMKSFSDRDGNIAYVGELTGNLFSPLHLGVFFTLFTSIKGKEELQISPLQHIKEEDRDYEAFEDQYALEDEKDRL